MKNSFIVYVLLFFYYSKFICALLNRPTINHSSDIKDFVLSSVLGRHSINELLYQNGFCLYNNYN